MDLSRKEGRGNVGDTGEGWIWHLGDDGKAGGAEAGRSGEDALN